MEPCKAMQSVNKAAVNWRGQLFILMTDKSCRSHGSVVFLSKTA